MNIKVNKIAGILALILVAGCDKNNIPAETSETTITAIDGYLGNAEVYADRNSNGIAEESELIGNTDDDGKIAIPSTDTAFNIIVSAIVGQTRDSDKAGTVEQNYELIGSGSGEVVTPLTTIAILQDITLAELAAELNLDEGAVSGDYIALENPKVHLLARSMVPIISTEPTNEVLGTAIDAITAVIEEAENTGEDLDSIIIKVADDGTAQAQTVPPTLEKFLDNIGLNEFGLSFALQQQDGFTFFAFDSQNKQATIPGNIPETVNMAFDSNDPNSLFFTWDKAQSGGTCEDAEFSSTQCRSNIVFNFVTLNDDFAFSITEFFVEKTNDVSILFSSDQSDDPGSLSGINLEQEVIAKNQYYHLWDASTDPNSVISAMPGLAEVNIVITTASSGEITIDGESYVVLAGNSDNYVIRRVSDNYLSVLIRSKDLADHLLEAWKEGIAASSES